jgi:membrane protein
VLVHVAWSLTIGWLFWFVVYSLVPNTTVSLQASAIGALVCSILIEIAKRSLGAYLSNAFTVSQFYGSLGLVPLFMFWVYLMWVFVLFGLEVSATLQFLGNRALEEIENRRATTGLVEPAAVVSVMEVIAEDFIAGLPTAQRKIADRTGVPEKAVAVIVQELCKNGLLHRIERDQNAVCLAQSPELVTADRLMDVGFQLADGAGERRISQFAERLREHQRALAKSITLASLVPAKAMGTT